MESNILYMQRYIQINLIWMEFLNKNNNNNNKNKKKTQKRQIDVLMELQVSFIQL